MARKKRQPKPPAEPAKIFEAELASGPSGAVLRGVEIDMTGAIARRQAGENIVVCGGSLRANRQLAQSVESAIGPYERQVPHDELAGPLALPHFQQGDRAFRGHAFYETENRRARTK